MNFYSLGNTIGEGGYSSVRKCFDSYGNRLCAKVLPKVRNKRENVANELNIMQMLSGSPRVPRLVDAVEDNTNYYIIQELCRGGHLKSGTYSSNTVGKVTHDILCALRDIHKAGVIHRDIKPGNILFVTADIESEIKLCDYGLALMCDQNDFVEVDMMRGTPVYMSPENLDMRYTFKSDIWNLGIVVYLMICGKLPFNAYNYKDLWIEIKNKNPNMNGGVWADIDLEAKDFVRACLEKSEQERISLEECFRHPFIQSVLDPVGEPLIGIKFSS